VLLGGTTSRATPFDGEFMQCDVEALFRPVTKGERSPIRDRGIVAALRHAFELAAECRPGPVVVALPADALQHTVTDDREDPVERSPEPRIAGTAIDKAARRLAAARRPLAIIGKGARWNDAYRDIAALIDRVGMPFITSPIARGFLPDDHPLCFNAVATSAQQGADVVEILGAWLDWTFRYGTQIARDATLIQIDPDPGEFHRNRAVALPIEGAIGACVRALLERISTLDRACERPGVDQEWTARLALSRNAALERRRREGQPSSGPITPQRLAQVLNDALPADALCMFDGNVVLAACERQIVARTPVSRLTPGTSGCLGTGVPYAIGAKLACPDRPVVAVCGDFAFGLTAFEIETAVRHDVPIVVVIANNDGNGGALRQREMFGDASVGRVAAFQPGIHYEQIAAMFGGHAEHVACAGELASALRRALAANRPACVNVAIDPEAPPPRG
jgi:2-hydroxyacyl-CoA lyase 1